MQYAELIDRIRGVLSDLDRTVKRVNRAWEEAKRHPNEQDLLLDSVALNLHAFYSGIESLLEHIGRSLDGSIPTGQAWHRKLLAQMTRDLAPQRPAVISENVRVRLDEYRRFRHFVRNAYALQLRPDRLSKLVNQLPHAWAQVRAELDAFANFLQVQSNKHLE